MPQFYQFVKQELPEQTVARINLMLAKDIILLKSREFVAFPEYLAEDYHINLIPSAPPPLTINRKDHFFNKKSVIATPPGVLISCKHSLPTQDYYMVTISKNRFQEILSSISSKSKFTVPLSFPYSHQLFSCASTLMQEFEKRDIGYEFMVQSLLTEFIIQLIREGRILENMEKSIGKNYNYADRALEYLRTYYNASISLDDLCMELNLSRYHFIRIFKAQTGVTPHAYLINLRLEHALEYLSEKDFPLEQVSTLCGFVNQAHFSQCFKKKYGITPTQYRSRA